MNGFASTNNSVSGTIAERGRKVLGMERDALENAALLLGESFENAVRLIAACKGRVIVAGVGKSGLIGRKIAATLTSTGTPAMFLHPVESVHGDLGIVSSDDVAILLSKSGETTELLGLIDALSRLGVSIVSITADTNSRLARHSAIALDIGVKEEACPHDLAPTTSTTVTLALGDALAVALLQERGFGAEDFARFHPGGALGRKLLTRVHDVMVKDRIPVVNIEATMKEATVCLAGRRGIAIVSDDGKTIAGVITAGDLARLLERESDVMSVRVKEVMSVSPHIAQEDELGSSVVHRMEKFGIISMPVVNAEHHLTGVVHLHDLMRAGAN